MFKNEWCALRPAGVQYHFYFRFGDLRRVEVARSSFYFQGAIVYNNLPREIRMEKNYLKFKSLLKLI